jgi:hypothetical protein
MIFSEDLLCLSLCRFEASCVGHDALLSENGNERCCDPGLGEVDVREDWDVEGERGVQWSSEGREVVRMREFRGGGHRVAEGVSSSGISKWTDFVLCLCCRGGEGFWRIVGVAIFEAGRKRKQMVSVWIRGFCLVRL